MRVLILSKNNYKMCLTDNKRNMVNLILFNGFHQLIRIAKVGGGKAEKNKTFEKTRIYISNL